MIDDDLHGVHGPGVAVFMLMGNRELSSGGPFFKDITTLKTHVTQELYNYMYSSHTQTEPFRGGLHGVYDLLFTSGDSPPKMLMDLGFVDASLGLKGFLDNAGRGSISGLVSGVSGQLPATVGLRNAGAEYWTRADANGNFALTGLRPGHYQITLYDNELEVAQSSADITAGNRTHYVLRARTLPGQVKWQIGLPDGTPSGFRNARLLVSAHPSDQRMAPWQPVNYRVGTSPESDFPAVQWRNVNTPTRISFSLCPNEVHDFTLRIFITLAQFGGRPQVSVNQRWNANVLEASVQPKSRGITRGTYRGNNTFYNIAIPGSALHLGMNTVDINVASGQTGHSFLSPGFVYDSVELIEE